MIEEALEVPEDEAHTLCEKAAVYALNLMGKNNGRLTQLPPLFSAGSKLIKKSARKEVKKQLLTELKLEEKEIDNLIEMFWEN